MTKMQAIQDLISIPKLKTKKRENKIKFSPNKSINKIVTPLFTFLPFLATKQSLLKKIEIKENPTEWWSLSETSPNRQA